MKLLEPSASEPSSSEPMEVPLASHEIPLRVYSLFHATHWDLVALQRDTIRELLRFLSAHMDYSIYELSLHLPDTGYPYALRDDLYIKDLLEEHRTQLTVLVRENPSQAIPRRLLLHKMVDKPYQIHTTLDFMNPYPEDLSYLKDWIVWYERTSAVHAVLLPWDHPQFPTMINNITYALDHAFDIDVRPHFPNKFYLGRQPTAVACELRLQRLADPAGLLCAPAASPVSSEQDQGISLEQRNALLHFFRTLGPEKVYHRITFYVGPGVLGNTTEEFVPLTKEAMKYVDLILADAIWTVSQP